MDVKDSKFLRYLLQSMSTDSQRERNSLFTEKDTTEYNFFE